MTEESLEKIAEQSLTEDHRHHHQHHHQYHHHYYQLGGVGGGEGGVGEGGGGGSSGGGERGRFSQQRDALKVRQLLAQDLSEGTGVIHSPSASASTLSVPTHSTACPIKNILLIHTLIIHSTTEP